jgi:anti-sigma B factor antagonist
MRKERRQKGGMTITVERVEELIVLKIDGKTSLVRIKDVVNEQIEQGNKKIVADLRGVSFIDSAGLGDLMAAYTIARRFGGVIKLVSDSRKVDDLLDITRISSVFDKYATVEEAVKSF